MSIGAIVAWVVIVIVVFNLVLLLLFGFDFWREARRNRDWEAWIDSDD